MIRDASVIRTGTWGRQREIPAMAYIKPELQRMRLKRVYMYARNPRPSRFGLLLDGTWRCKDVFISLAKKSER
jgi:hypothetical protein